MSGHSKWSSIKHKKAATDAKKGKIFTQVANQISLAAKQGGGDPKMNFSLRLAMDRAKAVNMPSTNIERAIKKGTGDGGGTRIEECVYEGYGPGGTALLIETATDNKNRTVGEIRAAFTKSGGTLGNAGSVAYLFDHRGQIVISFSNQKITKEEASLLVIESGADDFLENDEGLIIYTQPSDLASVKNFLEEAGLLIDSTELTYITKTDIVVSDSEKIKSLLKLVDTLEDQDDVLAVHANFEILEGAN